MHIFVRMVRLLLTLGTIDILCLVNSNFCAAKVTFKVSERLPTDFGY